jgi:hypothetical protein
MMWNHPGNGTLAAGGAGVPGDAVVLPEPRPGRVTASPVTAGRSAVSRR